MRIADVVLRTKKLGTDSGLGAVIVRRKQWDSL
jgi:hypothetical protein